MKNYRITIVADISSSLKKKDLENKLVASLFDIETEKKIFDGESKKLEVINYQVTEAIQLTKNSYA